VERTEARKYSNLAARILLTLHLVDRRGYGLCLSHLSGTLIGGEIPKDMVFRELQTMSGISHNDGIYCLEGSESLLPETKRRLMYNVAPGARYVTEAHLFASALLGVRWVTEMQKPYALFGDRI
jgi:hypothetical protein